MSDRTELPPLPVTVLYHGGGVLAVDKPAGLAVIPERSPGPTLLSILETSLGKKLFVVHRLDRETSGVLLFAGDARVHAHLNAAFEHRLVKKHYVAVVHGSLEPDTGTIDAPLRQFGSGRMGADRERGKPSRTDYKVRARVPGYTLVDVYPVTGRRHQIRVHLYGLGHPVVGDPVYGVPRKGARRERGDETAAAPGGIPGREEGFPAGRLMLHALELSFPDPSGAMVSVSSPLPGEFAAFST